MAQKRMFDKSIMETDSFMDMPMPTKALYFLLGMEADDEGFVSPKRVMRIYGGNDDDIKLLAAKGFVIHFKSGVLVITSWYENNYLDKNRMKETKYQAEKAMIGLSNNKYSLISVSVKQALNNGSTVVQPEESSIEENRIEQSSIEEKSETLSPRKPQDITLEDLEQIAQRYQVPLSFVKSKQEDMELWAGEKDGRARGRNWKLTLMNWVKKDALSLRKEANANTKRGIDARNL